MKLNDLTERNKKFQDAVAQITELIHHKSVLDCCSQLIRSARRMDAMLRKLLATKNEMQFNTVIESLEDESDEIIFILDQLTEFDKKNSTNVMKRTVKQGFDVISLYSFACDRLIASRLSRDEFDH
ncbi:MAG: hypothetical protein AAFO69_21355 [Bacteroidota bacterium]